MQVVIQDFTKSVADIVRGDYRTADVFKKYGINFCCGGQVSLLEACVARNLDYNAVLDELTASTRNISLSNRLEFSEWRLDFLIDYIINVHHAYLAINLPLLEKSLISFMHDHSRKFPELEEILETFVELSLLLTTHTRHEEEIIFPYIKQIDNTFKRKEVYGNLFVRTLRKPLNNIEKEHNAISELLLRLQLLTNNYQFPSNACTNHQVIYRKLAEFHDEMVQHKHLENNILFPRAIQMENALLQY